MNLADRSDLEKYLVDENFKTDFLNKQKEKLKNINLIEKDYEELYGWKSLLSKNRPLSCYTHSKKQKVSNANEHKINKTDKNKTLKTEENKDLENNLSNFNSNQEVYEKEIEEFLNKDLSAETFNLNIKKKKYKHPFRDDVNNIICNENEKNILSSWEKADLRKEKNNQEFIFPIALIDEAEDKLYEFITIPKNISERRRKMEFFLHIQKNSRVKSGKIKNKNGEKKSAKIDNNNKKSISANNSEIINSNYRDEFVQASNNFSNNNTKNKKFNKTFTKSIKNNNPKLNNSIISQSLVTRNRKKLNLGNSAIRPMSVFAKRSDSAVYYMSKEFSDYFKQDLKEFSEKFSLLHPKIRCDNTKIKKLLEEIKILQDQDEKLMKNFKIDNDEFDIKDLNLAGNSKNIIIPLLKSFLKNYHKEDEMNKFFKDRIYPISNRPLGNRVTRIDNKLNIRNKNLEDLRTSINSLRNSINENQLKIDTYDKNDPDLKIFSENLEEYNKGNSIIENSTIEKASVNKDNENTNLNENKNIEIGTSNSPKFLYNNSIEKLEMNKSIEDANFEMIIPKSEVFKEKKISSRPKTAMNKKDFVSNSKLYLIYLCR